MKDKRKFNVWVCKIVVEDGEFPPGFDTPPRMAAIEAVESAGFEALMCSSGWGGELDDYDREFLKRELETVPDTTGEIEL